MKAWGNLSGPAKGFVEGTVAAALGGALDAAYQLATTPGSALDLRAIGAAAALAGIIYVRAHYQGLLRYPDGSTIHADPAPPHG